MKRYFLTNDKVKYLGRALYADDMLWCTWSATGAEFVTDGKKLAVMIVGDEAADNTEAVDDRARIAIYVDGQRMLDTLIDAGEKMLELELSAADSHIVRIIKLSESAMSTYAIKYIECDGNITPTPALDKYIEIIGDSITCGYGVDDEDPEHHFVTATEDVTGSYSYKTVSKLGYDYSICSLSGYGIISGYTDDISIIRDDQRMPEFYKYMGYAKTPFMGKLAAKVSWDFSLERETDIIVINLGTNDESYCQEDKARHTLYRDEYVKFLKLVRNCHKSGHILCILGIMGEKLCPALKEAVEIYKNETGDACISSLMFKEQLEEDGRVADYHPTRVTHEKMAVRLAAEIEKLVK